MRVYRHQLFSWFYSAYVLKKKRKKRDRKKEIRCRGKNQLRKSFENKIVSFLKKSIKEKNENLSFYCLEIEIRMRNKQEIQRHKTERQKIDKI